MAQYDYSPLWKTLEDKKLTKYYLTQNGINPRIISKLIHNKNVTVETLATIAEILKCKVEDIIEIKIDNIN